MGLGKNETAELDIILSDEAQRDNKDGAAMNAAYDAGDEDVQKAGVSSSQDLSGDDATVDLEEEDAEPEEDPWNAAFKTKTKIITPWMVMSAAFQLLGGKAAGKALTESEIVNNPVGGLMMGVMVTV
ncbi:hypothetical protein BSL78_04272 [Apostichopus japonicus]|uniref:Uncharacterized protein n=1 Tax=Stichopus japonicus TaxID=307972 RepID=A0A2G8LEZ2_STIJA|nr:hypothetical protein BSL78_04272 [Apostichopus japonicus]